MNGKFRVWYKKYVCWLDKNDFLLDGNGTLCEHESYNEVKNPDYYVLQFFIGRQDKNSRDVYIGDLLVADRNGENQVIWEVIWDEKTLGIYLYRHCGKQQDDPLFGFRSDLEIIGNIFENPELLENSQ